MPADAGSICVSDRADRCYPSFIPIEATSTLVLFVSSLKSTSGEAFRLRLCSSIVAAKKKQNNHRVVVVIRRSNKTKPLAIGTISEIEGFVGTSRLYLSQSGRRCTCGLAPTLNCRRQAARREAPNSLSSSLDPGGGINLDFYSCALPLPHQRPTTS